MLSEATRHVERSETSPAYNEILRFAQNDGVGAKKEEVTDNQVLTKLITDY